MEISNQEGDIEENEGIGRTGDVPLTSFAADRNCSYSWIEGGLITLGNTKLVVNIRLLETGITYNSPHHPRCAMRGWHRDLAEVPYR